VHGGLPSNFSSDDLVGCLSNMFLSVLYTFFFYFNNNVSSKFRSVESYGEDSSFRNGQNLIHCTLWGDPY
jgi:hypothetical protein